MKIFTNWFGQTIKMAATPIYGTEPLNRLQLKLICSIKDAGHHSLNYDPRLTLTNFVPRSNLSTYAFVREK